MSAAEDETAPLLLTAGQLAIRLGVSLEFVRRQCRAGAWPHRRLSRMYRFAPEDVEAIVRLSGRSLVVASAEPELAAAATAPPPRARRTYAAYTRRGAQ